MDDKSVGDWLAARRKMIVAVLGFIAVVTSGVLHADLVIQALWAVLGAFGVYQVPNDQ